LGEGIVPADSEAVLSLRLPDDAAAVVAPWPTGGNAANYAAIVAVTGDLDAVMADLVAQVGARFGPNDTHDELTEVEGSPLREISGDEAGGAKLAITAVTIDGRSWITVASDYD
jgi:hypothetical protein